MKFYLGTHRAAWLSQTCVPLFVSRRAMPKQRFSRATCRWALDSGGFTELTIHGRWTVEPREYADEVRNYAEEVGRMDWAAIQDWMCEPAVISGGTISGRRAPGTGLSVEEHQHLTTQSLLDLERIAPEVPWSPVLQGWDLSDYAKHLEIYARAGVDLHAYPVVGVGSVCRRQATDEIAEVFAELSRTGLRLHGFGVKRGGLLKAAHHLTSADSLAWSFAARRQKLLLPECEGEQHKNCANCMRWALKWREKIINECLSTCA